MTTRDPAERDAEEQGYQDAMQSDRFGDRLYYRAKAYSGVRTHHKAYMQGYARGWRERDTRRLGGGT